MLTAPPCQLLYYGVEVFGRVHIMRMALSHIDELSSSSDRRVARVYRVSQQDLFGKLYEIREKLQNNSIFIFAVYKKGSKSYFLERNTIFFVNDVRFARKHI